MFWIVFELVCVFCPHSSWGDGLKLANCRPSLRRDAASKPISLWRQTTPFEWSALKYCESYLHFLSNSFQMCSQEIIFACFIFPWNKHEMWLSGMKQKRRAEENRRDWSHRGSEESGQAGNKLFIRWVRHLIHNNCYIRQSSPCITSGENIVGDLLLILFCAPEHHSPALLPLLDTVHWLRELRPGVFLHGCPEALPRWLCLDPGPNTNLAGLHHRESQGDLRQQQHRCEQDDCQQTARVWQNSLSSNGNATQDGAVVDGREKVFYHLFPRNMVIVAKRVD